MKAVLKNFAIVFLVAFVALAIAVGYGSMGGQLLSRDPVIASLRYLGGGLMIAGLSFWVALLRDEAGKPSFNPMLILMAVAGVLQVTFNLLDPAGMLASALGWGGFGLTIVALVLGLIAMLISPANSQAQTSRWPQGDDQTMGQKSSETHSPEMH